MLFIISHVELLQSLLISKCNVMVSLKDFSDSNKGIGSIGSMQFFFSSDSVTSVRQLRDKLISEDMMKLAIDISTKCGIESEPVWAGESILCRSNKAHCTNYISSLKKAWGLQLLKMGRYTEAKEKFEHCLVPFDRTSVNPNGVDSNQLLHSSMSTCILICLKLTETTLSHIDSRVWKSCRLQNPSRQ